MDENDRRAHGFEVRSQVLGQAYVDAAVIGSSALTADFQEYLTRTAWGEIWSRPGLDRKHRSMVTISVLTALGHEHELALHIRAAVQNNGLTPEEVAEVIMHASVYAGLPAANRAMAVAQRELAELGFAQAEPGSGNSG
ncbi:MAG: carboxymuconolactone decarboxylase family protein [Geodermatophilaceae bacterium]|nr:carboxymuconolactone decarboxylase family protein [Geodermatophilaceae bacterium]